jgi:hypothetical protein
LKGLGAGLGIGGLGWQTAVGAPLAEIPAWQFALAHLIYGLVLGFWFGKNSWQQGET